MPISGSQKAGMAGNFLSRGLHSFMETRGMLRQEQRQREQDVMSRRVTESQLKTQDLMQQARQMEIDFKKRTQDIDVAIKENEAKRARSLAKIAELQAAHYTPEVASEIAKLKKALIDSDLKELDYKQQQLQYRNMMEFMADFVNRYSQQPQPTAKAQPTGPLGPRAETTTPKQTAMETLMPILSQIEKQKGVAPRPAYTAPTERLAAEPDLQLLLQPPDIRGEIMGTLQREMPLMGYTGKTLERTLQKTFAGGKPVDLLEAGADKQKVINQYYENAGKQIERLKEMGYKTDDFPVDFQDRLANTRMQRVLQYGDTGLGAEHRALQEVISAVNLERLFDREYNRRPGIVRSSKNVLDDKIYDPSEVNEAIAEISPEDRATYFNESDGPISLSEISDALTEQGVVRTPITKADFNKHTFVRILEKITEGERPAKEKEMKLPPAFGALRTGYKAGAAGMEAARQMMSQFFTGEPAPEFMTPSQIAQTVKKPFMPSPKEVMAAEKERLINMLAEDAYSAESLNLALIKNQIGAKVSKNMTLNNLLDILIRKGKIKAANRTIIASWLIQDLRSPWLLEQYGLKGYILNPKEGEEFKKRMEKLSTRK